ncbi:hypothetical protein [Enterobacter sp. PTB]|uniref:hypothetical protein n=1 Tax=Enterobacter sp. PTB TaxID=3143437 RepID=UPI003DA7F4C8
MRAGIPGLNRLAWLLLAVQAVAQAAAERPTTALPPAPDAFTPVAVAYPPVPIAGTEWEKTVRKREAERRRATQTTRETGTRHRAGLKH